LGQLFSNTSVSTRTYSPCSLFFRLSATLRLVLSGMMKSFFKVCLINTLLPSPQNENAPCYNTSRPHMSLGLGIPSPPETLPVALGEDRHQLPEKLRVAARQVLSSLHHDYVLVPWAA
jgi:hypothetical protein